MVNLAIQYLYVFSDHYDYFKEINYIPYGLVIDSLLISRDNVNECGQVKIYYQ